MGNSNKSKLILNDNIINSSSYKYKLYDNLDCIKKIKSLYSFDVFLYSYLKESKEHLKFNKLKSKLKYYPEFICIKSDNKIIYKYNYYDIKSWAHGKNIFVINTNQDEKITLFYFEPFKCAEKINKICNNILLKSKRDNENLLE